MENLDTASERPGPLAEFVALRQEIDSRSERQYRILALQLTSAGAVFGFALAAPNRILVLLVIPFSTYLLSSYLATQARWTTHVAEYMKVSLHGRVPGGLGWEKWLAENPYPGRWLEGLLPMLLAFPGASAIALVSTSRAAFSDLHEVRNAPLAIIWLMGMFVAILTYVTSIRIGRLTWAIGRR